MLDGVLHVEKFARGNWNFRVKEKETGTCSRNSQQIIYSHVLRGFFPSRQTRALQAAAFSEGEFLIIITRGFYSERNKFRQSVIFD